MQHVALLCGGSSTEYAISLLSARHVYEGLDKTRYQVSIVEITPEGQWQLQSPAWLQDPKHAALPEPKTLSFRSQARAFQWATDAGPLEVDVVLPILHGPFGEDGTVQGFLKTCQLPFIGVDILCSAIARDKDVMKRLWQKANLPIAPMHVLRAYETPPSFAWVSQTLGCPFFLKPASLGSSVGVARVQDEASYHEAIQKAFRFDTKVLLETYIEGVELELALLGKPGAWTVTDAAQLKPKHSFYSYEAKYLDPEGAVFNIPAPIPAEVVALAQSLAIKAAETLECEGLARVDFFLDKKNTLYLNEINTLPGFTAISMYPKLMAYQGIQLTELLERLIDLAICRHQDQAGRRAQSV